MTVDSLGKRIKKWVIICQCQCAQSLVIPEWLYRGSTFKIWISLRGLSLASPFTLPDKTLGNDVWNSWKTNNTQGILMRFLCMDPRYNHSGMTQVEPQVNHMVVVNIIGRKP